MKSTDIKYIGVNDHQVDLFEGQYVVPNGMAYNSYLINDDKLAVIDTVDQHFGEEWLNNLKQELGDKIPDYLIIQHMEPDHSANIANFLKQYPNTTVVGNATTFKMIENFFGNIINNKLVVANGDSLNLGKHELTFVFAPMVHWPEVMLTYDASSKTLFSADAFGKFGALDKQEEWIDEARRYYIGIVGKYGLQVQNVLKAAKTLDIETICPLHGPILENDLTYYLNLYDIWSSYQVEEKGTTICYASIYGNTKKAAELLAEELKKQNQKVEIYDLSRCDIHEAIASAFKFNKLVLASVTYNAEIFPVMQSYIKNLTERNYQNRIIALMENGSWAPTANKVMSSMFEKSKNIEILEKMISIKSALSEDSANQIKELAQVLIQKD